MTKKRTAVVVASLVLALGAAGAGAALAGSHGQSSTTYVLLFTAIVAAVGGVVSAILTVVGSSATEGEQRRLAQSQSAMAEDLRLLAELTQTSMEEARAQRPAPTVELLLRDGSSSAGEWNRQIDARPIDIDAITSAERQAAQATAPRPRSELPASVAGQLQASALAFQLIGGGAVTDDDRAAFEKTVDEYIGSLRRWLASFEAWRAHRRRLLALAFRLSNNGRVPARDVRVHLHFGDAFEPAIKPPSIDAPPPRPRFRRRGLFDLSSSALGVGGLRSLRMPAITPINQNVTGPYYRDGSVLVEYDIKKLLHGIAEDTKDPALLLIDSDGTYRVPWEIHADNIAEPVAGDLSVKLESIVTREPAIKSLDEVIECLPQSARPQANDE